MTTIRDIAGAVGVSVATVSNVLNGRPNVGADVRKRVLRVAKQLGYRPNRAAQAMRTGRTRTIGLVLPDLTNPYFPELAQAVERTARQAGLLVCLIDSQGSREGESDGFALLMQHAVDGIIWCPLGSRRPAGVKQWRGPLVLIDRPRPGHDVVHADYLMGGRLLAQYARAMGHAKVGLLCGPQELASARLRREGFVQAWARPARVVWEHSVGFDGVLSPAAIQALRRPRGASLVVCGNDLIAISAMRCLAEHGLRVPLDVSVTGFDNIHWAGLVSPTLTTIAQPVGAIGARAVEVLRARLAGTALASRRSVFEVALVERESVRHL